MCTIYFVSSALILNPNLLLRCKILSTVFLESFRLNIVVILKSSAGWQGINDKVITAVFLEGGTEFTTIVVDVGTANNSESVLLPTEVWYIYSFSHIVIICLSGHSMEILKSIGQMLIIYFSV